MVSEFERFAGIQFDPVIAKRFLEILEEGVSDVDLATLAETVVGNAPAQPAA